MLLFAVKPYQDISRAQFYRTIIDAETLQHATDVVEFFLIDQIDPMRYLHRRIFPVQIGRGVHQADQHDDDQEPVFPRRILINHMNLKLLYSNIFNGAFW